MAEAAQGVIKLREATGEHFFGLYHLGNDER